MNENRRGKIRGATQYLFTLILFILGIGYAYQHREELALITSIKSSDALIIAATLFIFFLTTGLTFTLLVRLVGQRLTIIEILGLTFLTNLINYLGPVRPGAAAKAMYLKSEKKLPYSTFSAVLAANSFVLLFITGITGLALLFILWNASNVLQIQLFIVCIAVTCLSALPFLLRLSHINSTGVFWDFINNAIEGFKNIKSQRISLLMVCASILLQFIISALLMIFAYSAIGDDLSLTMALVIGVFTSLSNMFTLTPNNIGVQELIMAYLYSILGMDFNHGLLGAALIRAIHIFLTLIFTPIFTYWMLRKSSFQWKDVLPGR